MTLFPTALFRRRSSQILLVALLLLLLLAVSPASRWKSKWIFPNRYSDTFGYSFPIDPNDPDHQTQECGRLGDLKQLVITVKTGASEAEDRIPTLMTTSLRCAPNVFIFSDMFQDVKGYRIYDSLDDVAPEVSKENPAFELYRLQQKLKKSHPDHFVTALKASMSDLEKAAWDLDRYKNLHIVEKAWELRPKSDWYLHIDADTYVFLSSLAPWLRTLEPSEQIYGGSMACVGMGFAHGGSGILISRAATENLVVGHKGEAARWDPKISEFPYGDLVLAYAFKEYGIPVSNAWPIINGETPATIPFAQHHWCQPIVTVHHISPQEAERLGQFERRREHPHAALLYSELFKNYVLPDIPEYREHWDNLAAGEAVQGVGSAEDCVKACAANEDCFQSRYNGEECMLGLESFTLGVSHTMENEKKWVSSWNKTRIERWVERQEPCGNPDFHFRTDLWC